ncbi:hypothetical protein AB1L42_02775 [Thalassoglobus sp. JC818]|uniref:hypothetical protein n=1 Tax=Thalassoglobus sp. JC818 TaxID=3232136 RepID=UPI00345819A4
MSFVQNLFAAILPSSWMDEMQKSTERWSVRCCRCDNSRSLWDAGGIRWGKMSVGNVQRTLAWCRDCQEVTTAAVERNDAAEDSERCFDRVEAS